MVRITHLEMTSRQQWVRRPSKAADLDVRECVVRQPTFSRFLYEYVGGGWRWTDRLVWTAQQWQDYVTADNLRTFVAGYYELQHQSAGSVEICALGLVPDFIGRGYGGPLLDSAVENAFAWSAQRIWLHTCTYDHPNALNNYLRSGFNVFKVEEEPA
jgi:GNAT superfamily N-acetyltransferase